PPSLPPSASPSTRPPRPAGPPRLRAGAPPLPPTRSACAASPPRCPAPPTTTTSRSEEQNHGWTNPHPAAQPARTRPAPRRMDRDEERQDLPGQVEDLAAHLPHPRLHRGRRRAVRRHRRA